MFVDMKRPLWREDGSVVYNWWALTAQSFSGPMLMGLMTIFFCLRFETSPTWRVGCPYLYSPGTGWPSYIPKNRVWTDQYIFSTGPILRGTKPEHSRNRKKRWRQCGAAVSFTRAVIYVPGRPHKSRTHGGARYEWAEGGSNVTWCLKAGIEQPEKYCGDFHCQVTPQGYTLTADLPGTNIFSQNGNN
jgi:hypothetical protein